MHRFRAASRLAHPDKNDGSTAAFERVSAAHDCLGDPEKRAAYDRGDLDGAQTALEGVAALIEVSPTAAAEVDAVSVYGWLGDLATEVGNYESAALFYDKGISQT